jgi:ribosomal protein L39E
MAEIKKAKAERTDTRVGAWVRMNLKKSPVSADTHPAG